MFIRLHRGLVAIALLAVLPVSSAMAGTLSAVINGKSYHIDSTYDWNEDNVGFGLEYQFASKSKWKKVVMANGFRDSNDRMSYMTGAGVHRRLLESEKLSGFYLDAGINAFFMTREDVNENRPFPGALPSLSIGNSRAGINVAYLPMKAVEKFLNMRAADPSLSGIVFVQFKISIK